MGVKAIDAAGLTKVFVTGRARVSAVQGLDLQVDQGELVAFLGPNGAGKSTSLRLLTTLLVPTGGMASVYGYDIRKQAAAVRGQIGYIGQANSAGHNHRVRDEIITQGLFYGLSKHASVQQADRLIDTLELRAVCRQKVSSLSGGQRRRLDIAMGLVHDPPLLFLDEPSTGLDPQSRANLWRHIRRLREEHGTTVFMTTHYLDEADEFAERVLVMDHGRVIADDTPARLKDHLIGDRVVVEFDSPAQARSALPRLREYVSEGHHKDVVHRGGEVELPVPHARGHLPEIVLALAQDGLRVRGTETKRPTLDDVFLSLTGRSLRESGVAEVSSAGERNQEENV
ncbi:ATP-binding cassette domain-containing protein (plasmid) [Nocardiopsis flavescens]|nr:ATP-binding cassette domain-containing protein [Nocardiopsis flavescens]